jgi:CRISPR/Cas system-associated exonuclease Cas4 (RecB family)
MIYSYTQISQFLLCPKRYEYRYIDGWRPPDNQANMLFGRCFENALCALFRRKDAGAALCDAWSQYRESDLVYPRGESWDHMLRGGLTLLHLFAQDAKVTIPSPQTDLQVPLRHTLDEDHVFQGFADAIGFIDQQRVLIDWKTTSVRYPDEPPELISLDPQLVCYSWLSGIARVGLVVFVRKRVPEIQYLVSEITEQQRRDFEELAREVITQIEAGRLPRHCGIRFPNNVCPGCPYVGMCLGAPNSCAKLERTLGGGLDWLDELDY